jgi:hypothetical protein
MSPVRKNTKSNTKTQKWHFTTNHKILFLKRKKITFCQPTENIEVGTKKQPPVAEHSS